MNFYDWIAKQLSRARNIIFSTMVIGSLILIAVLIFIVTAMGKRAEDFEPFIETEFTTRKEFRRLFVYEYDSLRTEMSYELVITETDSTIIYKYVNVVDSSMNMSFRYSKQTRLIISGPHKYEQLKKDNYQAKLSFDLYRAHEIIDGPGDLLFNSDYGILGFDNGWGKHFYFVSHEYVNQLNMPILH